MDYNNFYSKTFGHTTPYTWQIDLAESHCQNRTIRIPTGFGKTMGAFGAWLWNRVVHNDENWPRRLVWCLPMRVLVEQTEDEVRQALEKISLLWDGKSDHHGKIGLHLLMGGSDTGEWHLYPEENAVLIGTQDMLLSKAMNRGYGSPRARWPMEFGLLNQDALWILDEVQLMDVGLATATQLQAFRHEDRKKATNVRPGYTWWMSATLQKSWLEKSPDTKELIIDLPQTTIAANQRKGILWEDVHKPFTLEDFNNLKDVANRIAESHVHAGCGLEGPTLVVLNTVDRAVEIYNLLNQNKNLKKNKTDLRLVHSRFRNLERKNWRGDFLYREASIPGSNRIIVATQVVEAGVDISAALLFTEIAPWPGLVQRFGRCARWGGTAQVVVMDLPAGLARTAVEKAHVAEQKKSDRKKRVDEAGIIEKAETKAAIPYSIDEIRAARTALKTLKDVSPVHLEKFEEENPEALPGLYPFDPPHLLLRHEIEELFDTTPDLSGADIDISRFIRKGGERDLSVFWVDVPPEEFPQPERRPLRDELCTVPFLRARDWLCGKETSQVRKPRLDKTKRAWVFDYLEGEWRVAERKDLYPGQTVMVAAECGGYHPLTGWNPDNEETVSMLVAVSDQESDADESEQSEALSISEWKTIATHSSEVAQEAGEIAELLIPRLKYLFALAGIWHDAGKSFPAFQESIRPDIDGNPGRKDLAKAPRVAWLKGKKLYPMPDGTRRAGFRHELASALALFGVLQKNHPEHQALVGPYKKLLLATGQFKASIMSGEKRTPSILEQSILNLEPEEFDLLIYLVCSHHGKVRVSWHTTPADQKSGDSISRIHGIREGDSLPGLVLIGEDGNLYDLPDSTLDLSPALAGLNPKTGRGWTERVLGLLDNYGPFILAWLEAIFRSADIRASKKKTTDPLLEENHAGRTLERGHQTLEKPFSGRTEKDPPLPDPEAGSPQYGLRGGTGGREDAGSGTQTPHHATRHLKTTLGVISYTELAPHLSRRVQDIETDIAIGIYSNRSINENLILEIHHKICGDLTPEMAGRWRSVNVIVGNHEPPAYPLVPSLMKEYVLDIHARLERLSDSPDDLIPEFLAFTEGRFLSIHPFADFNGRTVRVLLSHLLKELGLPYLSLTPDPGDETRNYLNALRAADQMDWQPLIHVWKSRFDKEEG